MPGAGCRVCADMETRKHVLRQRHAARSTPQPSTEHPAARIKNRVSGGSMQRIGVSFGFNVAACATDRCFGCGPELPWAAQRSPSSYAAMMAATWSLWCQPSTEASAHLADCASVALPRSTRQHPPVPAGSAVVGIGTHGCHARTGARARCTRVGAGAGARKHRGREHTERRAFHGRTPAARSRDATGARSMSRIPYERILSFGILLRSLGFGLQQE